MTLRDRSTGEIAMGPGPEFDTIREMLRRWGPRARGIGDDAALLDVPPGQHLAVSIDASVEEVHFRRAWLTAHEIGYRSTVAALSDLAAMAATPLGLVSALAIPESWRAELHDIAEGIGEAAERFAVPIVGGNMTAGERLTLTVTVLGTVSRPLPRSGVQPGDTLYVTGALGGSGAALAALLEGDVPEAAHRARFARPEPRLAEARWLAAHGARAAIDVSDGLGAELAHLAAASGVHIDVNAAAVPLASGVDAATALRSGEEYELVVSGAALDARAFAVAFSLPLTAIGTARATQPGEAAGVSIAGVDTMPKGASRVARGQGHDHFSS
jgi:thiamine-monophosphate kinase